jgi:hypothetical protein
LSFQVLQTYYARHMSHRVPRPLRLALLFLLTSLVAELRAAELLPPGFRPLPLGVHALVGGKVVIKPGETLDEGTIIIRDGYIRAVGKEVAPPADARIWDMKGTVVYAGFIEPYFVAASTNAPVSTTDSEPVVASSLTSGVKFYGVPGVQTDMGNPGPGYEIARVTPEYRAVRDYSPKDKTLAPMREIGFTTALLAPGKGIIRGTSALIALSEENPNQVVLKPDVFQHVAFDASRSLLSRFVDGCHCDCSAKLFRRPALLARPCGLRKAPAKPASSGV